MSPAPLAEGTHQCRVACPGADRACLALFFQSPKRPMSALLSQERMDVRGDDQFLYRSRTFRLINFEINPEVLFSTRWVDEELRIAFVRCRIRGLGPIERLVRFDCEAVLKPQDHAVEAHARAAVTLQGDSPLLLLPMALRRQIAEQALQRVFERLERRCQGRLRRSLHRWIGRQNRENINVLDPG
ncbi:MAG: DUF1997 domain-containing protein [Synechococcus sp.]|nr:DUF1997 domain-containing protein [Synechococcus sp.]